MKQLLAFIFLFSLNSFAVDELQTFSSIKPFADKSYAGLWGYTDKNGREYAILGVEHGTQIVDITDATPKNISFIPAKGSPSIWTELKVYKTYAYVVKDSSNNGIQIIDLSKLPDSASLVTTVMDYPQNHTLWIDEERALMFTVGGSNTSVTVWSLAEPTKPKIISTFNKGTYVHDMYVQGNRAYLAEITSKSFSIYDITDVTNPKMITRVRDPKAPSISFHNAWTTEDGKYLVTTEETSKRTVKIWDLKDETKPVLVSEYLGPNNLAHNVRIKGKYMHIAHYGGGYRVVDISDITKPVEVAFHDPDGMSTGGFVQVWDVFPFFKSGKVIVSSMDGGLFVTKFDKY